MDVKRKQSLYQDTLLTSPRTRTHRNPNLHDETLPLVPLNGHAHANGNANGNGHALRNSNGRDSTPAANGDAGANGTSNGHANHSSDAADVPMLVSAAETPSRTRDARRSSVDSSGYSRRTRCLLWLSAAGAAWIIVTAVAVVLYVHVRGSSIANATSIEVSLDGGRQLTVQVSAGGSSGRPAGPQVGQLAGGRTSGTCSLRTQPLPLPETLRAGRDQRADRRPLRLFAGTSSREQLLHRSRSITE